MSLVTVESVKGIDINQGGSTLVDVAFSRQYSVVGHSFEESMAHIFQRINSTFANEPLLEDLEEVVSVCFSSTNGYWRCDECGCKFLGNDKSI